MKNVHKLKWALLILLIGMVAKVDAQTRVNWSGTIGTQDITQNTNITLSGDVDLQGIIIINECAVTLDLNGYVIKRNGHGGYACIVSTNGTLTINDSRPNVPHYGKPSSFYAEYKTFEVLWEYNASYTASTPGAIRIDGGIMSGGFGLIGGGVCCYGNLVMNGGTLAGNNVASDHYMVKNSSGNWVLHTRRPNTCDEMREAWNGMGTGGCYHYLDLNDPSSVTVYNQCMGEGGGVYVGPQGSFVMNGGRICYNYASFHGGGVYAGGPFTMKNSSKIDHNYSAGGYGAGVFISNNVEFQPCVNGIPNGPWPNYIEECGVMTMFNGEIAYNNAYGGSGGGIMAWYESELTINNGNIHHNLALGRRGGGVGNGGGIYCETVNKFEVTNVNITDNECARYGGGMMVYKGTEVDWTNSTCNILRNIARPRTDDPYASSGHEGRGGGVVITQNGSVPVTFGSAVSISNNQAKYGGGIYASGASSTLKGTTVDNNTADIDGGGLHIEVASITVQQNSKIRNNTATSGRGGGVFVQSSSAVYTQTNSELTNNTAGSHGGGVYMNTGTVSLTNANVKYNKSNNGNGGGIYAGTGNITVDNTVLFRNKANNGGGGGIFANLGSSGLITIKNNTIMCKNSAKNGGGLYTYSGNIAFQGGTIGGNTASTSGGGVYANYPVNLSGGIIGRNDTISGNTAVNGGGIYANNNVTLNSGRISGNGATNGGGVYVASGVFTLTNGYVGGLTNLNLGNYTTGSNGKGAGIYMASGTANLQGGGVIGNNANGGSGGGIYINGGTCTLSSGAAIGGVYSTYGNNATYGGGIYANGGSITVKGGQITNNTATDGGGIYSNSTASVTITKEGSTLSQIQYNSATNGGAVYANQGTVTFSDGNINYNYASNAGGGMYVNDGGTLNLKGNAILNRNHVPTGKKGGGIYLKGTVKVGEASGKAQSSVTANMNFAHTLTGSESVTTYTPTDATRNNIYLPNPVANPYTGSQHRDVIWVYENGIATGSSVGFSVPSNHVPVIYCQRSSTSWAYLDRFTTGEGHDLNTVLFDDTHRYKSVHYTTSPVFDPDHVYLFGFWPEMVNNISQVPTGGFVVNGNTVTIGNKEGLAWLISYVNGLNGSDPHNSADLVVNLEADLDMSAYGWVPIGFKGNGASTPAPFRGTFNGKGHTIKGVYGLVYGQGNQGFWDYGLFGYVDGGLIQDVFVKGMEYYIDNNENLILGGLVGEKTNGVVSNSEVQSKLVAQNAQSLIGGLIGKQTGGSLHSSIGIADMTGGRMGGLVGQNSSELYNSFANAKFTSIDNTKYSGGLVAINSGTVENCYVHLRGTEPASTSNYGWLVGENQTGGNLNYCYSPATDRYYKTNDGTLTGCGNYADNATAPYTYRHRDTQVTIADGGVNNGGTSNPHKPAEYDPAIVNPDVIDAGESDKQLLLWLNHWVGTTTYAPWQRPATTVINGNMPMLMMPKADAAAATTGDPFIDYDQVNTLLSEYTQATQAVWLYRKKDGLAGNSTSNAKLYIADKGSDGKPVTVIPNGTVKAYVGVMLDNSAGKQGANPTFGDGTPDYTDWHMFSSPLTNAPLGIDYNGNTTQYSFSYDHPTGMPYWRFYDGENTRGYFPSHRYGESYPTTDASLLAGNYYEEWDFYTYTEPEYHWINFKRNSNSHWHENEQSEPIHYHPYDGAPEGNETTLVQGRGYLLATREQTFLQCRGTLADGNVTIPVTCSGYNSPGYNFLGNPYLAYLDFNKFAEANSGSGKLWADVNDAGYGIIDEDQKGYVYYAYDASLNIHTAPQFIAPHQGFMLHLAAESTNPATFTTGTVSGQYDMRSLIGDDGEFRGEERPAYPLVNMLAYDNNGNRSIATVELGRPDKGGLQLMRDLKGAKCHVYCRYEGEDWSVVFTQPGLTEAAIRFEAFEDGEYTMRWNTQNGEFHYLHLVDNQTGADVDCLATDEYRFTATTEDYRSRFRLVFGYTGIEEPEAGDIQDASFAFQSGKELVVTGEGVLTMFDVTGRAVMSTETYGVQTAAPLPGVAAGVYLLRLETANGTKVQKIVIK